MKLLLLLLTLLAPFVWAKSTSGDRVLVLSDDADALRKSHSKFLKSLTDRGYELSFKPVADAVAVEYEERLFDHILLIAPQTRKFGAKLGNEGFVEFVRKGGNLLVVASSDANSATRDLAAEFGVQFAASKSHVVDFVSNEKDKTLVKVLAQKSPVLSSFPLLYRGIGHRLDAQNTLVFSLLSGNPTSFSWDSDTTKKPVSREAELLGVSVSLVSAVQARNNARVVVAGSVEMFSDELFSVNSKALQELTKWNFQESQVLRVKAVRDRRRSEPKDAPVRDWYRIKDEISYEIDIEEFNGESWKPFALPEGDRIQFEAVMLDPYLRIDLLPSNKTKGRFELGAGIRLPDQHGVFTFKCEYKRHGYSFISEKRSISLRPFRHNEYPRFLTAAYPYYVGSWSMIVSFVLFAVTYLFFEAKTKKE